VFANVGLLVVGPTLMRGRRSRVVPSREGERSDSAVCLRTFGVRGRIPLSVTCGGGEVSSEISESPDEMTPSLTSISVHI